MTFLPDSHSFAFAREPSNNMLLATTNCVNPNLYIYLITNRYTHTHITQHTQKHIWEENESWKEAVFLTESLKCTAIVIWNEDIQQDENATWGLGTVSDPSKVSNSS